MMKLREVVINRYKSYRKRQTISIDDSVTVLVGMNESGKSVLLEGLAKLNYFKLGDPRFQYDMAQDFPRKEFVKAQKSSEKIEIITAKFDISDHLMKKIADELGDGVVANTFSLSRYWGDDGDHLPVLKCNLDQFIKNLQFISKDRIPENLAESFNKVQFFDGLIELARINTEVPTLLRYVEEIRSRVSENSKDVLADYVYDKFLKPVLPKFWYFDEFYKIPSQINVSDYSNDNYSDEESKMITALLGISGIDLAELVSAKDFDVFNAHLEDASNKVTEELMQFWKGKSGIEIELKAHRTLKKEKTRIKTLPKSYNGNRRREIIREADNTTEDVTITIHIKDTAEKVRIPIDRRSKGFNWFLSFVLWFNMIKNSKQQQYILLLDEPGLNLHGLAQADLLKFIESLGQKYQVIYSTHSPFMIDTRHLSRVRTIMDTTEGSIASESIQERDSKTLFPLQAALGYDIAQNLFIAQSNLIIEGVSDLVYLNVMSAILESADRQGLKSSITLIPVGGLDKVASFISLMRGTKLDVACLLDTFTDQKSAARLKDLTSQSIIKAKNIRFFHEFIPPAAVADMEDLFEKVDYIKIFNHAFVGVYPPITLEDLQKDKSTIIQQIRGKLSANFNHYKPAIELCKMGVDSAYFSKTTLDRFEKVFMEINKLFP